MQNFERQSCFPFFFSVRGPIFKEDQIFLNLSDKFVGALNDSMKDQMEREIRQNLSASIANSTMANYNGVFQPLQRILHLKKMMPFEEIDEIIGFFSIIKAYGVQRE